MIILAIFVPLNFKNYIDMIRFKTGFVEEFLFRNYLGLDFGFDSFDELFSLCPNSWTTLLVFNLKFHAL